MSDWNRIVNNDKNAHLMPITYMRDGWQIIKVVPGPGRAIFRVYRPGAVFITETLTLVAAFDYVNEVTAVEVAR